MRPVRAGVIELDFQMQGENLREFLPPKKSALCSGIYDEPSRILRQNLSKMGGLDFFPKNFQRALRFCLFFEGEEEKGAGVPFSTRWPNSASDAKQVILVGIHSTKCL